MKNHANLFILAAGALFGLVACSNNAAASASKSSPASSAASSAVSSSVVSSSQDQASKFVLSAHYNESTKENIPADAVNRVMFIYGDNADVTFKTELTLDAGKGTHQLYKQIYGAGEDAETPNCNAAYYFRGSYERQGDAAHRPIFRFEAEISVISKGSSLMKHSVQIKKMKLGIVNLQKCVSESGRGKQVIVNGLKRR